MSYNAYKARTNEPDDIYANLHMIESRKLMRSPLGKRELAAKFGIQETSDDQTSSPPSPAGSL